MLVVASIFGLRPLLSKPNSYRSPLFPLLPITYTGVIHLPPLPGYPDCPGMEALSTKALDDLTTAMTRITQAVTKVAKHCISGCEILLNDPCASLAVSKISGAAFIGSGCTAQNAYELLSVCDGAIVGTSLIRDQHIAAEN